MPALWLGALLVATDELRAPFPAELVKLGRCSKLDW